MTAAQSRDDLCMGAGRHNVQGYVGTTFIIESSSDAIYLKAEDFHGLTSNTNWNGNRARIQLPGKDG
jgi:hypothetical protein